MLRIALLALTLICCTASAAEIRVWHSMSGVRGTEFQRLVARFNASQKQFRVVATYKGAYDEAVVEAFTARRTPRAPHLVQASELGAAFLLEQKDLARPLWQVATDSGQR
jgi:sn-glycerol 3-phosphate transport system substrate-binding protein